MGKGLSKELENTIRCILGKIVNEEPGYGFPTNPGTNPLIKYAVKYLEDIGALESERDGYRWRITAYGREYFEKLTAPRWYWLRQNWFPAVVALATIAASVGGIIVNALD